MLEKPAYGSACNSCGRCCQDELCALGQKVFARHQGPCPALANLDSGFGCGLILAPQLYAPMAAALYGEEAMGNSAALLCAAGAGCDAQGQDEIVDEAVRQRVLGVVRALPEAEIERAREMWRSPFII